MGITNNKISAQTDSLISYFHKVELNEALELAAANELLNALAIQFESLEQDSANPFTTLGEVAYEDHKEGLEKVEIFANSTIPFNLVMFGVYKYLYQGNIRQDFGPAFDEELRDLFGKLHVCYRNDERLDHKVAQAMKIGFERIGKKLTPKTLVMNYLNIITQVSAAKEWFSILSESENKINDFADLVEEWFTTHTPF